MNAGGRAGRVAPHRATRGPYYIGTVPPRIRFIRMRNPGGARSTAAAPPRVSPSSVHGEAQTNQALVWLMLALVHRTDP